MNLLWKPTVEESLISDRLSNHLLSFLPDVENLDGVCVTSDDKELMGYLNGLDQADVREAGLFRRQLIACKSICLFLKEDE